MRKPGLRSGTRRFQRFGQQTLDVGSTLVYSLGDSLTEAESLDFVGTCQSCGSYWDVRHYTRCPARIRGARCDGYIG